MIIDIGSALPDRVVVTADPAHISAGRPSTLRATVFDESGNPVQNVPVSFSVTGATERLDSGGAFLFTNSNGQVTDTLRIERGARKRGDGHGDRDHRERRHRHGDGGPRVSRCGARPLPRLAALTLAAPARAEIALLASGQTLKLSGHRSENGLEVLMLKGGGEVQLPAAAVRGYVPDEVLDEVSQASGPELTRLAEDASRRYGLEPALVLAVVAVESGFRPEAVSPKGAQGLMQLMPRTAAALGVSDPLDPEQNLDAGVRHLEALLKQYNGDLRRALAAYNAGQGAVAKHSGVPPYRETREYVKRVLERYRAKKAP